MAKYRASIDPRFLTKVDRVFDAAPQTVWNELLQNARRAGSTEVKVRIDKTNPDANASRIAFMDNGHGVETPEPLLRLAAEGWGGKIEEFEDPAGMGFFCLSNFPVVTVSSRDWMAQFTPEVFQGVKELETTDIPRGAQGTSITWQWEGKDQRELVVALREAARYCGIETVLVSLDDAPDPEWETVMVKGYLDDCAMTEHLETGYAIGITNRKEKGGGFVSECGFPNLHLNFMGVQLRLNDYTCPHLKWLCAINGIGIDVRVDVIRTPSGPHHTAGLQLVLPARNALKHNETRAVMIKDCERVVYRYISEHKKGKHSLPFSIYKRARDEFGIDIGEAKESLKRWDGNYFSSVDTMKQVVLVGNPVSYTTNLKKIWHRARHELVACKTDEEKIGYSWYDALPVLESADVEVDGEPLTDDEAFDDCQHDQRKEYEIVNRHYHLAESIKVTFCISDGRTIKCEPPVLVRGNGSTQAYWDLVHPDECWFHVLKDCADDNGMLNEVSDIIYAMVFEANTGGCDEDPPSQEEQQREFEIHLWCSLLEVFKTPTDAARYQLERHLAKIPNGVETGGFSWSISCEGVEGARRARPKIAYFHDMEQVKAGCRKLVAFVPRNTDGTVYHVTSAKQITPERMQRYLNESVGSTTDPGYDEEVDFMIIDHPGEILDLDAWEGGRGE